MVWSLGELNGRKCASCSWCSLEIRTDARSLRYLAAFPLIFTRFLSAGRSNNANVSIETKSKEEFSCTDVKKVSSVSSAVSTQLERLLMNMLHTAQQPAFTLISFS